MAKRKNNTGINITRVTAPEEDKRPVPCSFGDKVFIVVKTDKGYVKKKGMVKALSGCALTTWICTVIDSDEIMHYGLEFDENVFISEKSADKALKKINKKSEKIKGEKDEGKIC